MLSVLKSITAFFWNSVLREKKNKIVFQGSGEEQGANSIIL